MKRVVILSGGLDSTVLLYQSVTELGAENVFAISFRYEQRHMKEIACASRACKQLGVKHDVVDIADTAKLFGGNSLTDKNVPVPDGHYEDETMKLTVVPNRNMIFLSLATALAITRGADEVAYGAHDGDHAIYPDCRKEFADAMEKAIALCDWSEVRLVRSFLGARKEDIVAIGDSLGVPLEDTWSCYNGGSQHCGQCGTCKERIEAFSLSGVVDPTEYQAHVYP